jgi:hypothetical protein
MEEPIKPMGPLDGLLKAIDRLSKGVEKQYARFKKTPYTVPVALAITAVAYYLMLTYIPGSCWIGLIPSLLMFGILWQFEVRRVRKMLFYGLICALIILTISTAFIVNSFQTRDIEIARSPGADPVLVDGLVSPTSGGDTTVFTYSLTVRQGDPVVNVTDVRVNITSVAVSGTTSRNETMVKTGQNATLNETYYTYTTTLSAPYNEYHFVALVNDTWVRATDYYQDTQISIMGPMTTDTFALSLLVLRYVSLYQAFLQFFPIYAILCGMVWWMRRARRMREDAVRRWEDKRKEVEAKVPDDKKKIATTTSTPSLERAMGLEAEPETFVCSDCGADVPAEAKNCPVCGEKFE